MIDVLVLKITTTNYYWDKGSNTRPGIRICKQSFEEEDNSSFGDIKRRTEAKNTLKGLNQLTKVIKY